MEKLTADILDLLDAYEAELDCRSELDSIDADEMLDSDA